MKVAIIDADLVNRAKHRFPNLACLKMSGYYKEQGHEVVLKTDYENLDDYDLVTISKVFEDTPFDENILTAEYKRAKIQYGGTGFTYDKVNENGEIIASLPDEIEHHMPDYHLYDDWVNEKLEEIAVDTKGNVILDKNGNPKKKYKRKDFTYYLDYSIGFTTRGCFRHCSFCVNRNHNKVVLHSPVSEFLDVERPYICLLDDNVLGTPRWKEIFEELIATGKKFQFKQGVDERLLNDEKCEYLFNKSKWIGDRIFAFDNLKDRKLIEEKLQLIRQHTNNQIKFYTFCGYDHNNPTEAPKNYTDEFWKQDIIELFERIKILMNYGCLPYVMRHKNYEYSPYRGIYINAASWANQPSLFRKMTFEEYSKARGMSNDDYSEYKCDFQRYLEEKNIDENNTEKLGSSWRYYKQFVDKFPEIEEEYFRMRWDYSNKNIKK
jgi:hypothetical protein